MKETNFKVNDLIIDLDQVKIVIEKDEIDKYEKQALDFFEKIFNINYEEMIVTDIAQVSDFIPLLVDEIKLSPENIGRARLDACALHKINSVYNLDLTSTNVKIVDILKRLV